MLKQLIKYKKMILKQFTSNVKLIGVFSIIIILIVFIQEKGFKKIAEGFENANLIDVLNGLDIQDQKLNNMINKIGVDTVNFDKNIKTTKGISSTGKIKTDDKLCIGDSCITSFKPTCRKINTGWKDGADKENRFLDRLHISCKPNEYMNSYKYHTNGNKQMVSATCCKLPGT